MTITEPTLFDDLALTFLPEGSSAEGDTRGPGDSATPAPGVAPNVRASDPETSHIAAANAQREQVAAIVTRLLSEHPDGLTDWQLYELSGLPEHLRGSLIKRRGESGAVDSGQRGSSPSGRPVIVWTLGGAS